MRSRAAVAASSVVAATAWTPASCLAAVMSTDTIFACGCVLRSSLQYSVRGNARSSAKRVAPVTFATASTFRIAFPMILCPAMDHLPHALGRELDGFVDLDVAGAAAEVARQRVLDLVARGVGIRGQ